MNKKHSKEFIVIDNAVLTCSKGQKQGYFLPEQEDNSETFFDTHKMILETNTRLSGFGICNPGKESCAYEPVENWNITCIGVSYEEINAITSNACLICKKGGMITIDDPGQYAIEIKDN